MKVELSYPYSPGHKDVDTSIEAAESMKDKTESIRNKVLNVISNKGIFGATADEVAELLNYSPFAVRPRVTELFKLNKIERKDKRKNLSNKAAYVYVVTNQSITKGI